MHDALEEFSSPNEGDAANVAPNVGVQDRSKNILIFADGTGQAGGLRPDQALTNVYKLYRATRVGPDSTIDPARQVAFYDAGLGTEPDAGGTPFRFFRWLRRFYSAATGTGISTNIIECYEAILRVYEPGDRIYLFGFSRGAYTARCVGGMLRLCGVPTTDGRGGPRPRWGRALRAIAAEAVRTVYEHGAGRNREAYEAEREEKARRFRHKYGSGEPGTNASNVSPYFIGVFDTVAALGARGLRRVLLLLFLGLGGAGLPALLLWDIWGWVPALVYLGIVALWILIDALTRRLKVFRPAQGLGFTWHLSGWKSGFYDQNLDPRVQYARHALAIDESRADFARVGWGHSQHKGPLRDADEPEWFQQIWFAGCHTDIGGGYSENESRLSDITLEWMVEQVITLKSPVTIDRSKLNMFPSAHGLQHCEVASLVDRYPLWWPRNLRPGWEIDTRVTARGGTWHRSVFDRLALPAVLQPQGLKPYRPEALAGDTRVPP